MAAKRRSRKDPNVYPPGMNRRRVQRIINVYERAANEDLFEGNEYIKQGPVLKQQFADSVWIEVPTKLLPQVKKLIRGHMKGCARARRVRK
jgi:hypothetical protein